MHKFKVGDKIQYKGMGTVYTVVRVREKDGWMGVVWNELYNLDKATQDWAKKEFFPTENYTLYKEALKLESSEAAHAPLVLQVGKFYKTRDGRKVRIDAILPEDNPKIKKVVGWYEQAYTSGFCRTVHHSEACWYNDGRFRNSPVQNDLDIVDVWTDPPSKPRTGEGWMILDEGGETSFRQTKPDKRFCPIRIRWEEICE